MSRTAIPPDTLLETTCESVVAGGRGLARHEGKVLLVAGALPGERVRVRVTKDAQRHAEADVVEVLSPHQDRREAPCPHASDCGGCDFQHATRDLQLSIKRSIVLDAFRRIGRLDVEELLEGPEAVGDEFGGRNRIRVSFDPIGRPGMLRRASHDVVPIDDCMLVDPRFGETVLPWLRLAPPWHRATCRLGSNGRSLVLFESGPTKSDKDHRRLAKVTKAMERPDEIAGLLGDRVPLGGSRELVFRVGEHELICDAAAFFQVNLAATEELVTVVDEWLGEDRRGLLLDLYAGVGLFSVTLGRSFDRLAASDVDPRAVRTLRRNLRRHKLRATVLAEPAHITLRDLPKNDVETVVLDPPREGLSKEVREQLAARASARIVSVSCDPATGARDVAALVAAGWRLEKLRAVDLFPVTAHVETVALLAR